MPVGALSVVFHSCVQPQMGFGFPDLNPRALRTFHLLSVGVHGQLRADITRESPHPSDSGSASLLDFLSLLLLPVHFGFMSKFHQDLLVHLADLLPSLLDFFCVGMDTMKIEEVILEKQSALLDLFSLQSHIPWYFYKQISGII